MSGQSDDHDSFGVPPVKPGMSTGTKILLALLVFLALASMVCCGVGVYIGRLVVKSTTTYEQPAEIREATAAIVDIEIPERFHPDSGMTSLVARVVFYTTDPKREHPESEGTLILTEMGAAVLGETLHDGLRHQLQQQMEKFQRELEQKAGADFKIETSEDRKFTIRGKEVTFRFLSVTGKDAVRWHAVSGTFPGKSGTCLLFVGLPDSEYHEEELLRLIESIH